MKSFSQYLAESNTVGTHNDGPGGPFQQGGGAYLSSSWTGSEMSSTPNYTGHALHLPSLDLAVPTMARTSRIEMLELHKNPIFISLQDGTKLFFTRDEFDRVSKQGSKPEIGKVMMVVFQRNPKDTGEKPSKIQYCRIL